MPIILFILFLIASPKSATAQYGPESWGGYTFFADADDCENIDISPDIGELDITYYTNLREETYWGCLFEFWGSCLLEGWITGLVYDDEINLGDMFLSRITNINCDEKNEVCFDVENLDLYSVLEPIPLGDLPGGSYLLL